MYSFHKITQLSPMIHNYRKLLNSSHHDHFTVSYPNSLLNKYLTSSERKITDQPELSIFKAPVISSLGIITHSSIFPKLTDIASESCQSISNSSAVTKVYPCFVKVSITSRAASTEVGYAS